MCSIESDSYCCYDCIVLQGRLQVELHVAHWVPWTFKFCPENILNYSSGIRKGDYLRLIQDQGITCMMAALQAHNLSKMILRYMSSRSLIWVIFLWSWQELCDLKTKPQMNFGRMISRYFHLYLYPFVTLFPKLCEKWAMTVRDGLIKRDTRSKKWN